MNRKSEIQLPTVPMATAVCVVCNQPISYQKFRTSHGQKVVRRVPKAHPGQCQMIYERGQEDARVREYVRKRQAEVQKR